MDVKSIKACVSMAVVLTYLLKKIVQSPQKSAIIELVKVLSALYFFILFFFMDIYV